MSTVVSSTKFALSEEESVHVAAHLLSQGSKIDALTHLKASIEKYPTSGTLLFLKGALYADIGMQDESIDSLRVASKHMAEPDAANLLLGMFLFLAGQAKEAEKSWRFVDELPKENALRTFKRGFQLLAEEDLVRAKETLELGLMQSGSFEEIDREILRLCNRIEAVLVETGEVDAAQILLSRYNGQ